MVPKEADQGGILGKPSGVLPGSARRGRGQEAFDPLPAPLHVQGAEMKGVGQKQFVGASFQGDEVLRHFKLSLRVLARLESERTGSPA